MFLDWIGVAVQNVSELLWYLKFHPPPELDVGKKSQIEPSPAPVQAKGGFFGGFLAAVGWKAAETPKNNVPVKVPPPPKVDALDRSLSHIFAVIIGINKYKDPKILNLHGAVADADDVHSFLVDRLHVPQDRIVNLRNEKATREALVAALTSLATEPKIAQGDPILIYYAGHGAEAKAAEGAGMVQMLLPHDFQHGGSEKAAHAGHGLFDVTLAKLLTTIAKGKSDNITVILDSCHSGSGTREYDVGGEPYNSRSVALPKGYTIPEDAFALDGLDVSSGTRSSAISAQADKAGLSSHVLLAACRKGQTAKEMHGRGAFTTALLKLLREDGGLDQTYKEVITRITMPDLSLQSPQCEGLHQTHALFNSKASRRHISIYRISAKEVGAQGEYTLAAGEAHGITQNAEFAVYTDIKRTQRIGSVIAKKTDMFETHCVIAGVGTPPFAIAESVYAVQTRVGDGQDLKLFIEASEGFLALFQALGKELDATKDQASRRTFHIVNSAKDNPDLALSIHDNVVQFHITEPVCVEYGLTRMPVRDIRPDETEYLFSVLCSAADFYWNLHHSARSSKKTGSLLGGKVTLECHKLVSNGEYNDAFQEVLVPDPTGLNLYNGNEITINVDEEEASYGFTVKNSSQVHMYAALFYFDVGDLSIEQYYLPGAATGNHVDFCLPANGSLTIGYGDGGAQPRSYFLENRDIDVGFLKLYVSNEFIDYSSIPQPSPFRSDRASRPCEPKRKRFWDTLTIPVIQKNSKFDEKSVGLQSRTANMNFGAEFGA